MFKHWPKIPRLENEVYHTTKDKGSFASKEYMKPEGLVVYAEKAKTYWKVIIDK